MKVFNEGFIDIRRNDDGIDVDVELEPEEIDEIEEIEDDFIDDLIDDVDFDECKCGRCGCNPCECEIDNDECEGGECHYDELLKETYKLLFNLQTVHWNAVGGDFFTLHEQLDDHIEYTRGIIDELAEMKLETATCIANPIDIIKEITDDEDVNLCAGFEKDEGFATVKYCEDNYIEALEKFYNCVEHDIQSTVDEWIRWYKVNSDYKIKRQQINKAY